MKWVGWDVNSVDRMEFWKWENSEETPTALPNLSIGTVTKIRSRDYSLVIPCVFLHKQDKFFRRLHSYDFIFFSFVVVFWGGFDTDLHYMSRKTSINVI